MTYNNTLSNDNCRKRVLKGTVLILFPFLLVGVLVGLFFSIKGGIFLLLMIGGAGTWQIIRGYNNLPFNVLFLNDSIIFIFKSRTKKLSYNAILHIIRLNSVITKKDIGFIIKLNSQKRRIDICLDKTIADEFERRFESFKNSQSTNIERISEEVK